VQRISGVLTIVPLLSTAPTMPRKLHVYQISDLVEYQEAFLFQRVMVKRLMEDPLKKGVLILLEHPPVITIGRSGSESNVIASQQDLMNSGVEVVETNRGGDVTYHGPGQIVGYPILPLVHHGKDVHEYLRRLEEVLIATLQGFAIDAQRREGLTGVWTPHGKIASIGVAISHWITYHGFALNVAPNLAHFDLINPCGMPGVSMTSMARLLDAVPQREDVEKRIIKHFQTGFGFDDVRIHDSLASPFKEL